MIARTIYLWWPFAQMFLGLVLAYRYWDRIGAKTYALYYLLRMVFLFTAWPMISKVPVDIKVWLIHAQWMSDSGLFPVADFPTAYHLGFNLILWLSYSIFHSPYSIMAAFNLFEIAAIPFMFLASKRIFGEKTAKRAVILFITAPLCWSCNLAGQDEPIIIFFSMVTLYALAKCKYFTSGILWFLCFAATKVLVPIYFWCMLIAAKWKGVALLVGGMLLYWIVAFAIGINPFDFRSGTDLNSPGFDLSQAGYVRGSVWQYLRSVPKPIHFIMLLGSWGITALVFIKALWNYGLEWMIRLRVACVLATIAGLEFFAFYRVCYYPYMLPFLPFALVSVLSLDIGQKRRMVIISLFVVWLGFIAHKEDGNAWIWGLGYFVDAILYFGYAFFIAVFMNANKKYLTSPLVGLRTVMSAVFPQ